MTAECTPEEWEDFHSQHTNVHILQTAQWGKLKDRFGWKSQPIVGHNTGAQVLFRTLLGNLKLAYIPKGPIGEWNTNFIRELGEQCRAHGAFVLKIEPDSIETETLQSTLHAMDFRPSYHNVQPQRTLIVDLEGDEDQILARMHQKTRYNIRLSLRKGVEVRALDDVESFSEMLAVTSERDQFGVHTYPYYQATYDLFAPQGQCALLVAEHEGEQLAAVMVFASGDRAWYFYGASTNQKRNLMPTYLLQWEAIRWARSVGCTSYDLWGVPDLELDQLERDFTLRSGGLWGVYRFKRGFGGNLVRSIGAWDLPLRPIQYSLYHLYSRLFTRQ